MICSFDPGSCPPNWLQRETERDRERECGGQFSFPHSAGRSEAMGDEERAYLVAGKRKDLEIIAAVLVVEFDEILVVASFRAVAREERRREFRQNRRRKEKRDDDFRRAR